VRRILALLAVALLATTAPAARATVGGEWLLEPLGWDAGAKRIWMHEIPTNEGEMFGAVLYFDLASADPAKLRNAGWSPTGEGSVEDATLQRRLAKLRARLAPLVPEADAVLPVHVEVVGMDSVLFMNRDWIHRARVRARFVGLDEYEITMFGPEWGISRSVWRVPGRPERLLVFSFVGDPAEGGYEVQVPLLARPGFSGTPPVSWWRARDH